RTRCCQTTPAVDSGGHLRRPTPPERTRGAARQGTSGFAPARPRPTRHPASHRAEITSGYFGIVHLLAINPVRPMTNLTGLPSCLEKQNVDGKAFLKWLH